MELSNRISMREEYVSPSSKVMSIACEGVLCSSGVDINDWEKDDDVLDFN